MGHENMELQNISKAISCYQQAIDLSENEYRAWYGLGQAYELLRMPNQALIHYKKAATLRPADSRMWCAVGSCFEVLKKHQMAIRAFERGMENDNEFIAAIRLAELYMNEKNYEASLHYNKIIFSNKAQVEEKDYYKACISMANIYQELGKQKEAAHFSRKALESESVEREEAKTILSTI